MRVARRMLAMGALSVPYPAVSVYYTSPGGAGDSLTASTNAAARAVFGGAPAQAFTIGCWARNVTGANFMRARDSDNQPYMAFLSAGEFDLDIYDALGSVGSAYNTAASPYDPSWGLFLAVSDGTTLTIYANGDSASGETTIDLSGMAFAASDIFEAIAPSNAGDLCQPFVFSRALSAGEIAAIYAQGPTADIRNVTGPAAFLWRDAPSGGAVANVGTGGTCNLTVAGSVTTGAL